MFAVFCPACQHRVLLRASHIVCLVTSRADTGRPVHLLGFRSWCGQLDTTVVPGPTKDALPPAAAPATCSPGTSPPGPPAGRGVPGQAEEHR